MILVARVVSFLQFTPFGVSVRRTSFLIEFGWNDEISYLDL